MARATQEHKTCPNLLKRQFDQGEPEKVLLTDITYLRYGNGQWAYLSCVKDGATRQILAEYVSSTLELSLVERTLDRLLERLSLATARNLLMSYRRKLDYPGRAPFVVGEPAEFAPAIPGDRHFGIFVIDDLDPARIPAPNVRATSALYDDALKLLLPDHCEKICARSLPLRSSSVRLQHFLQQLLQPGKWP